MTRVTLLFSALLALFLLQSTTALQAQSVDSAFRAAIQRRYNREMVKYTVVPYKNKYFGSCHGIGPARGIPTVPNTPGQTDSTHFAIYEYVNGHWSFIFEFNAGVDADEGAAALNQLFARYGFSADMRAKLMYGNERRVY